MKTISSRTNPAIKQVASLKSKKGRSTHNQFVAQGIRACSALIDQKLLPDALYVTQNNLEAAQEIISDERIVIVDPHVMEKISSETTSSGMLGVFPIPPAPKPSQLKTGIVLAQISDPGNMGTLIRTAAALAIPSIVIIQGADPWSPKVVQASAGTIGMVDIFQWDWQQLITHKTNKKLCALVASGGKSPKEIQFANSLIVVGSEAHGMPEAWIADCEEKLTLPMPGNAESLNAAVAGSIALYMAYGE